MTISGPISGDVTESQSSQRGGGGSGDEARTVRRRGEDGDVGAKSG